jgi:hypothetical protein
MKRPLAILAGSGLILALGAVAAAETQQSLLERFPFDPACPWGRIANGKGMVVRCVSEAEAAELKTRTPPPAPASSTIAPGEPIPGDAGAPVDEGSDQKLEVTVGPVTADEGTLPIGKLGQPKDKYAKCVTDNGGLKDKSGEVHVRFLVRSKGVAEGVSVAKRSNVTPEAARCVAEVVDRRRVAVPDSPMVGATVVVKFAKLK